jgi:hypothetical protein
MILVMSNHTSVCPVHYIDLTVLLGMIRSGKPWRLVGQNCEHVRMLPGICGRHCRQDGATFEEDCELRDCGGR